MPQKLRRARERVFLTRDIVLAVFLIFLIAFVMLWMAATLADLAVYTRDRHDRQQTATTAPVTTRTVDERYPFPPHHHAPGTPPHTHGNAFDITYLDGYGNAQDTRNGLVYNTRRQWWEQP